MNRIKLMVAIMGLALIGAFAFAPVSMVGALDPLAGACASGSNSEICNNKNENAEDLIAKVVEVSLFIVGTLSVVMIIFSGVLYVISTGDAGKVAKAKNTLMYSIVGLVVSFLAYAIVFWVLKLF